MTQQVNGHVNGDTNDEFDGQEDCLQFIEERFGRNLSPSLAANAKLAIRRRIAGSLRLDVELEEAMKSSTLSGDTRRVEGFSADDVYLHPTGMSSIFNTHRVMMAARGPLQSVCFGFPYIDTLKILQKWGPGCLFYGHGASEDLDDLEARLRRGERYLALFCEALADEFDFAVVVDETIGNFINVHVLPYADVVVSSLTKVFSGDSNVMGGGHSVKGSLLRRSILNPKGRYFQLLKRTLEKEYEDDYWAEDAIFMERNSRDFVSRIEKINANAEAICDTLRSHKRSTAPVGQPTIKQVYYPKCSPTRSHYERCRNPNGGYGGLLSTTFFSTAEAVTFFDRLETAKGPSLGTNFTLW
ncbi:MAG: hypothetical protein M1832_002948 [Thelocarpon impressellum]|nr:MAG: hypothetical protein M1832_002948 [Thelocarpon impressellum]